MRTGLAQLPLHGGKAPRWLFTRMVRLAREVVCQLTAVYGPGGVTITTCSAVKEGIRGLGHELGLYAAGGKGAASRKTPQEIITACKRLWYEPDTLVYASRFSAKGDNSAVQDDYQLYHYCFFSTRKGQWCVVQQGVPHAVTTGWDTASTASSTSPAMPGEGH